MKTFFVKSLAIFLSVISLSYCRDDLDESLVELYYDEKACVDIWEKTNVRQYLEERGIYPAEIKRQWILPEGAMVCLACYCPSGWGIFIKIPPEQVDKAIEIGFMRL